MRFDIYKDNEFVNSIEASEEFVAYYCEQNNCTFMAVAVPDPEPEPTTEEILKTMLGVTRYE